MGYMKYIMIQDMCKDIISKVNPVKSSFPMPASLCFTGSVYWIESQSWHKFFPDSKKLSRYWKQGHFYPPPPMSACNINTYIACTHAIYVFFHKNVTLTSINTFKINK